MTELANTFVQFKNDGNLGKVDVSRESGWYDTSVPCQTACPAGTNVPAYLKAIREGNFEKAYEINLQDNVFPAVLGRICTRPCEPACRHGRDGLGESVAICFSKRSASDFKTNHQPTILKPMFGPSGKRMAVVGAGPAGLTAARDLTLFGHEVCVFERHDKPGGMMVQGIPEFRLPRDIVEAEIEQILQLGIQLRCGVEIGKDVTLEQLSKEYDAVVLSVGAHKTWMPELEGSELDGVHHGFNFMKDVNKGSAPEIGSSVVVIGGGFTAVDCAQSAGYLGAEKVEIIYRRDQEDMSCSSEEIDRMREEGISLQTRTLPKRFHGEQRVDQVDLLVTTNDQPGWSKDTDTVLIATGQRRSFKDLDPDARFQLDERIQTDGPSSHQVLDSNLFLCGDARAGAESIIHAIGDAKACARHMDDILMGGNRFSDGLRISELETTGRDRKHNETSRRQEEELDVSQRSMEEELIGGFDEQAAREEAWRCYMCNQKLEIDNDRCITCGLCLMVMPVEGCIVQVKKPAEDGSKTDFSTVHDFNTYDALVIDQDKCIRCNACRESCPVDCISLQAATPVTLPNGAICSVTKALACSSI